jgi:hypothetical protein
MRISQGSEKMGGIREEKKEEAINIHILDSAEENNSDCTHCITLLHYYAAFSRSSRLKLQLSLLLLSFILV